MVHGLGSKEAENLLGGADGQSGLVVLPTPGQVHRSSQLLGKGLSGIKWDLVPHHVIGRPGQLMRQSGMGRHEVGLGRFLIVVSPGRFIVAASQFSGFGEGPGQIFIAVLFIPFPFGFLVTGPLTRYLPAIGYKVADLGKSFYRPGFQHDGQR
jgi:hypothetical protein